MSNGQAIRHRGPNCSASGTRLGERCCQIRQRFWLFCVVKRHILTVLYRFRPFLLAITVQDKVEVAAEGPGDPQTDDEASLDTADYSEAGAQVKFGTPNLRSFGAAGYRCLGFEHCSPIQGRILPHTLGGNDAIGKAQTGTGKTAAFHHHF